MPDCNKETKYKCGVPCTIVLVNGNKSAWFQDCKTKNVGTGSTYDAARKNAAAKTKIINPCAGLTGSTKDACDKKQSTLFSPKSIQNLFKESSRPGRPVVIKKLGEEIKRGGDTGLTRETTPQDVSNLILGSPEDWGKAIDAQSNCFGIPIPCPLLAIGVGAVIVLIVALR